MCSYTDNTLHNSNLHRLIFLGISVDVLCCTLTSTTLFAEKMLIMLLWQQKGAQGPS